jgi:stress-induced morphogen
MPRFVIALSAGLIAALLVAPANAAKMSDADKAAQKKATTECKAEIKEKAKYESMSWYARHKAVKNCVKDKLASH